MTKFRKSAQLLFGEDPNYLQRVTIGGNDYAFDGFGNNLVSFLPFSWFRELGGYKLGWSGCEEWWAGYPLIAWLQIQPGNGRAKGQLRLYAEVGPISNHAFRKNLVESIQSLANEKSLKRIRFRVGASEEGKRFSKFLKDNRVDINDFRDSAELTSAMKKLLELFQPEFAAISEILPQYVKYGTPL